MNLFYFLVFVVALPTCFSAPGSISFRTTQVEVDEIEFASVSLNVQRTGGSDGEINFLCKILNSTGNDFDELKTTGKFLSGETSATTNFYIKDDTEAEGNETFLVQLSLVPGSNGSVTDPRFANIKIIANDDAYGIVGFDMPNSIIFHEPRTSGTSKKFLRIQRQVGAYGPITVYWKVDPKDSKDNDIYPTTGVVHFQNGEKNKSLEFFVRIDNIIEQDEAFTFELTSVSGGAKLNNTLSKVVVTISKNDIPVRFALNHIAVPENQSSVVIWIYRGLDPTGTRPITSVDLTSSVSWYLKSDSALSNQDFSHSNGTVVFSNGDTKKSFMVTILEDDIPELSENFTVHLTSLSPDITLVPPTMCTIEILQSDDHAGVFGLTGNGSILLSEDGGDSASITIERTAGRFGRIVLTWKATSTGMELSKQISPTNGTVVFNDGEQYKAINIAVRQDFTPEEAFSFVVELIGVSVGRLTDDPSGRTQEVIVQDSDDVYGVFEFADDSYQKLSLASYPRMVDFVVNRNGGHLGTVAIGYDIKYLLPDGSDHSSAISIPTSGSVSMLSGQQNASVNFTISQEGFVQANSVFRILLTSVHLTEPAKTLVSPITPRLGTRQSLNLTVHAQFADGEIGFEITTMSVTEPDDGQTKQVKIRVLRDGTLYQANLLWSIVGVKTSDDVTPTSGSMTFEKGDNSVNITIQILPDSLPELDESFTLRLHNVSEANQKLQPGSSELVLTIKHNDNAGGMFQFENVGSIILHETIRSQFTVSVIRIGGDLDQRLVKIETTNGKDDFESSGAVLQFDKGVRRITKTFFVADDNIPEANETLVFRLISFGRPGQQGRLGNATEFSVTILANDDPNGIIVFLNTSLSIVESKDDRKSARFVLERTRGLFGQVAVFWSATSTVNSSLDVSPTFGKVVFSPGERFKILEIYSLSDNIPELNENFTLRLTQVEGGAKIGSPREAFLTIIRNDDAIEFAAPTHVRIPEGQRADFTILRKGRHDEAIVVNYTTRDGSATSDDGDYTPISDQVVFARGEVQKTISVLVPDDNKPESDENFTVVLTSSSGDTAIYGNTVAIVTIAASDDPNGIFHFDGNTVLNKTESEGKIVRFSVIRDRGTFGTVHVLWQVYKVFSNGSRLMPTSGDFEQTSGILVFEDRVQSKDLELKVLSDQIAEYEEKFEVVLVNVTGGHPGPGGKLSNSLTVAYLQVPTNDNPYGLFAFGANSLNVSVAEDTMPGFEYEAIVNLTVVRERGRDRNVGVSWCIYKTDEAASLGDIWDLVFLSKIVSSGVVESTRKKRPNTGTKALEFTDSYAVVNAFGKVPAKGFTVSAWLRLLPGHYGTILAKEATSTTSFYKLGIDTNAKITMEIMTTEGQMTASSNINTTILDDSWHNVMVTIHNETGVQFFYDGDCIGTNSSVKFTEILDNQGNLYLGVSKPNVDQFRGILQDVKIFTKILQGSEIKFIANPVSDVKPINGYLSYPASVASHVVAITTVNNLLAEDEKMFAVILVSSRGGADIATPRSSRATITVRKSDNANGLFAFSSSQSLSRIVDEETVRNISFQVQRTRGLHGQVSIVWEVTNENGSRANEDFIQAFGTLVFHDGEDEKTLIVMVYHDKKPELLERFSLRLVSAHSNDGKTESTPTSGASISAVSSVCNITIEENDSPYGLLQFSSSPPTSGGVVPLAGAFRVGVRESAGVLKLYIVRAQGTLGAIQCSWKTVPMTARADVDYREDAGTVSFLAGEKSDSIGINIIDNDKPELNKTFRVELYGATNGAEIGAGGVAVVVILPSDDAFGVVNFTSSSLSKVVTEGQTVNLQVQRIGGGLGAITIYWKVDGFGDNLVESSGEVLMNASQRTASLSFVVKEDMIPELSKSFLLRLTNVSSGRLASSGITSNITVLANDDPHGVFVFDPVLLSVEETNKNITLNIVRRKGTMGKTRVYYTSVPNSVQVKDVVYQRATANQDYRPVNGFVDFHTNQTLGSVVLTIIDDVIPEDNETVVVNLTSVVLTSDHVIQPEADGSPRIGVERLAQVVILRNDNASGIIRLSASAITVTEDTVGAFLSVIRSIGTFGEITVNIEVSPVTAQAAKDYTVNSNTVTIRDGQTNASVPVVIINDAASEFSETFIVRLLPKGQDGNILLGSPSECTVTIQESDYPYGLIGFSVLSLNQIVSEPSSNNKLVTLDVLRHYGYGTLGVVRFEWRVTLHGRLATNDVQQTKGGSLIRPGENKTSFDIVVLADTVPEINEVLLVSLNITEGRAELNPDRRIANVTILLNDEAHGVVEFGQETYTVQEKDKNTTAHIPIVRKRGTHGDLRVYYSTLQSTSSYAAIAYQDYIPVANASVTIADGTNVSAVDILIIGDNTPELPKSFNIVLERVELINSVTSSRPRIGAQSSTNVTIDDDDHVYGLFKIFAEFNRSRIFVNETDGLAVSLKVQRYGGDTGNVGVRAVISSESTARESQDFKGSDVTFSFRDGEHQKYLTLSINSDDIPERDETIVVKLVNPTGGASVAQGTGNNVTVVILANDVVAGKIGFSLSSQAVVVKEGQVIVLNVVRTSPAAGTVTVGWVIQGENVTKDFNVTSGTVQFNEGQNMTFIKTQVLADNTSEVDEQFQVILRNPMTSGVSWTGAAQINTRMGTATVTVAASNEPHGVLEFQQSSRRVTVRENENILKLSVARLFGNIGAIRLYFTILNSSVHHLTSDERLAIPGEDVDVENSSSITIENGVSVGEIPIHVVDDSLAELDEFFLVNITRVELVHSSSQSVNNETFTPPHLGRYLTSEVKIEENDGTHGILVFSPSRVRVPENITVFNLTVLRSQGTFGDIEVSYFINKLSISEKDFSVYGDLVIGGENTLKFVNGQRTQNITVFIYDDDIPEGDEVFEVRLKKALGGASLGRESICVVTVVVNDAGNGIFKFDESSLHMFVDEPGNRHVGTTKASFTVLRQNGTIGEVVIGWSIANESASMDFRFVNGSVTFKDGERRKSFEVETVVDTTPEKKERFLIVLSVLAGGGDLMSPSQAWLTVSENDAPYGEFGFAVSPHILSIEETVGFTEIKVLRHKGTYGRVTVDYHTTSLTADGSTGAVMKFGIFQSFKTQSAQTWHPFSAYGKQYLLLGTSNTSVSGNHGNVDAYVGSSLYYWQGVYTHISEIQTNNAVQWESFNISDQYYIAVANQGSEKDYEVSSTIYKLHQNGTMSFYQNILTRAASDVNFFKPSGNSSSYLIFSNMKDNNGNTAIPSQVYKWSSGQFVQHGSGLNCRGASGLTLFTISGCDMLSISSFYDSVNKNFQSKSVIFEWRNERFEPKQEVTTNGATGVEYFKIDSDHFLLFVNSRSSPSLYKWSGKTFILHQDLSVSNAKAIKEFSMNGEVFLAVTLHDGSSQLFKWYSLAAAFRFYTNITDSGAVGVQPITLQDPVVKNVSLLAVAMAGASESRLLQPVLMAAQADFIPRSGQLIFENGDTELSVFITIFKDTVSEPDETFLISLSNSSGGSILSADKNLEVKILSNGNPYGRLSFATSSLSVIVNERTRDSKVYLEVLREQGRYGEVIVAWNGTGNATGRHGDGDVFPTSGKVIFQEGETRKTINLTIVADDVPEVNEVLVVSLTSLEKDGSDIPNHGATINTARDTATVVIKANDEPHGIVGWQRTVVLAQESEATNSTVQLVVERLRGNIGDIEISFETVKATLGSSSNERPAIPYQDFIPVADVIVMADGVNITTIVVNVIHDDNAEVNEVFFVNITAVRLLHSSSLPSENSPRISLSSQTAKVVISENDNKRGELNFNTSNFLDPRTGILKIDENVGKLLLHVVRSGGTYGRVGFEYRLVPETVNNNDYSPTKGQIIFQPNETLRVLEINVTDDNEAEVAERFRVEMTQPIGGAKLGNQREVTVEIRASDQPYGVFEFTGPSSIVMEEGREVHLTVARLQGSFREVHVKWNLSVGAFPDVYPANGTLTFEDNITSQVIRLRARDDTIPEGDRAYVCYLVSADNGGVIGSESSVRLRLDANDDGYGVMAVDPATSLVYVGEPDLPSYNGQVTISVVRNAGTYGEILVDWELTSDDGVVGKAAETFNQTRGTIVFADGVKLRNISLQVKQDSYPEETGNYSFRLTGTRDARIDQSASQATVVVVSSDHPYGIIEFDGLTSRNVSENIGQVILNVIRHKGHNGKLLVTINVLTHGATEGEDFQISPKVLTIDDKQDYGSINVSILAESVPELSESFTLTLGNIELITSRQINFGYKDGLQLDMPPEVGKHNSVVITIMKNDDAHGVVEFMETRRVVHEHDKSILISIVRSGGVFGVIRASYTVTNITAEYGKDYVFSDGSITFDNDQHIANLTIPLLDDNLPEDRESFRLELTSVNGGARLGVKTRIQIFIETSDNPDGLFGFFGKTRYVISNPNATQVLGLGVSRIGGARSLVRVKIRVFKTFPSPAAVTIDVSPETKELTFQVDDIGPKQFELTILPFIERREVEEHFVVSITDVSGNASIDSLTSNVTVVILKHGMPNGLFGFSDPATKTVSEGGASVVLMVQRKEGREGTVEVKWAIFNSGGPVDDFVNNAGTLIFPPGEEHKQISLTVNNDDIPELNEKFTVTLLAASGGGDIDKTSSNATIIISASDNPHGRFRLRSNAQRITVENDLSRTLSFTIERIGGRFGNIRVDYTLKYSKSYPSSLDGYVTIQNGENEKTQSIVLDNSAFLSPGSHFTLTLSGVSYEGPGVVSTDPPTLISSDKTKDIAVPDRAANSVVKFKDGSTTLSVNQGNQVPRVFVSRDGLYGSVTVFIDSGYPVNKFSGFTKGLVQPSVSSITFDGNDREVEFSVQVTPVLVPKQKLIYAVYLSRVTTPANVHGGSRIETAGQTAIIEPGGVIVVAMASQNIVVKETEAAQITVYRLFSCVGPINVKYSTRNTSSASSNKDYREIYSEFSMAQGEYMKTINVEIINDATPELDETFIVHITGVSGADTRLGINTTSIITIVDDDSPHGILSFATTSVTVFENVTVVDIVISRSGGTFGDVGVQVRTIGGGELWERSVRTEIKNVLKRREKSRTAQSGDDYTSLNTRVTFKNEVPTPLNGQNKTVQLYINNDDKAELNEDIFLYLSDPTGEAVLANLSTGGQSWTIVTIEGNDLMNGKIGFEKLSLTIDEDKNPQGEIKVTRTPSLGTAKVTWQALNSNGNLLANGNLLETNGTITFSPNQSSSTLVIELKQDNTPELESNFQVKLVSLVDTREASIDPAKNVVDVLVLASDDPAGLIGFDKESRNVPVDVTTTHTVSLTVTRAQGTHGKVTVSYRTTMLLEQITEGELVINRAIDGKDYNIAKGTLVFDAGKKESDKIVIELTPTSASSSSYPKAFNVTLSSVTGGARLNAKFSTTMVILSNTKSTTQFLKLRSDSLRTPLSNSDMTKVLQSLRSNVERPSTLTASHVSIVVGVLNAILDDNARRADEKQRTLTEDVSDLFVKVFDILLNPEREDLRGKSQLTEPFVKYAFALIHGEPCPGTSVVRKTGKYAIVEGRRRYEKDINGLILKSSSGRNFFTYPSDIYQTTVSSGTSSKCNDVHFIEYLTDHWFNKDNKKEILNNRVLSTSVKNASETNPNTGSSFFRIYTGDRRVTPKGAECLKWRDGSWDDTICSVKDESDDYVECQCSHFSNFAVRAQSDDRVGYQFYFYISAFICMISFFLVVLSHHTCSIENTFSSKLLMHMFFAGFALHLLVVVTAYVSPDLTDKPKQCTALGILIHYFLLAHFSWIFVQSCNLWRILVLNDERTDRKFILYFMLGWGVPVVFVALYIIITHALYGWDFTEIYADVHKNGDMCFISNGYGALASVLGPVLLFLLAVGVVATQAYQVTLQWKLYDDIFRGHHNIKEVVHLWIVFVGITLTWLFGGLHLAYGKQWLAILFAIFELFTGLYVFMVYFILRNQCRRKYRSQDAYLLNASSPSMLNGSPTDYYAERPVMYDAQSLQSLPKSDLRLSPPDGNEWTDFEYDGATPKGSRRVFNDPPLAQLNPLYDYYHGNKTAEANEDGDEEEESSQDFNNLIFALKTGETLEDDTKEDAVELKPESLGAEKLELRRVSIADTHV